MVSENKKTRILSGIRASGRLHLGNYLGALRNWIELQNKGDLEFGIFMIADYHAITTPYDPKTFHQSVLNVAIDFLAAGLDTNKVSLIRQSHVPQHTELAWLLNTITPISWLQRMPTYKEQLEKLPKYNHAGLLNYPVLMAADILIYRANLVPVGDDQLPHIDLANEIAKKFNHLFGKTFESIKPYIAKGARILSLQDPAKKMSKTSRQSERGAEQAGDGSLSLSDSPDMVRQKVRRAVTDSETEVKYDSENKQAISNLLTIYSLLSGKEIIDIEKKYENKGYGEFKEDLAEVIINFLKPFQEKRDKLEKSPDYIEKLLTQGEESAQSVARKTLADVKKKMGLI